MKIRITDTGEMRAIEYVDPMSGVEIANDMMGDACFEWIEDGCDLIPCLSLGDFEWWDSILSRLWEVETAAKKLGIDWQDHHEVLYSDFEGEVDAKERIIEEAMAEVGDEVR